MSDDGTEHRGRSSAVIFVILLLGLPLLLFLPLILSFVEYSTAGTNYVEEFCRDVGFHGFLSKIYEPILRLFSFLA